MVLEMLIYYTEWPDSVSRQFTNLDQFTLVEFI